MHPCNTLHRHAMVGFLMAGLALATPVAGTLLAQTPAHDTTPLEASPRAPATLSKNDALSQITAADIVGPDGIVYPDFTRTGIPGGIPGVKVVATVAAFGAVPNDDQDDSAAIQAAVAAASAKGGGAVLLPAGDYVIDRSISLDRDGVVLRGADRNKTRLIPRFRGQSAGGSVIDLAPAKASRRYDVYPDQPISRGDLRVHLSEKDLKLVRTGDIVAFTATPPADVIATLTPKLQQQATDGSYGSIYSWQYLNVVRVDEGTVTFDRPIRLDVALDQKPKLMHVPVMLSRCGVEDLTIAQSVERRDINGVSVQLSNGCWLKGVTVLKIGNNPVSWSRSWQFEMRDCHLDESLSRGGAVAYFGFSFACDGLIETVRATRLRHLSISMASNGLVFRNCFLENVDINFHLNWPYEVLFENCHVDSTVGSDPAQGEEGRGSYGFGLYTPRLDGDMHVPAGPRLTFYHNRFISGHDGVMLGGGATRHTIVAYNQFDVKNSFAAVIKAGSDGTLFRGNVFVLHNPGNRRRWMLPETYSHANPESVQAAVFFPQGAPKDVAFVGNRFYVPSPLPLYANGNPSVDQSNTVIARPATSGATTPAPTVPSLYAWQKPRGRGRVTTINRAMSGTPPK